MRTGAFGKEVPVVRVHIFLIRPVLLAGGRGFLIVPSRENSLPVRRKNLTSWKRTIKMALGPQDQRRTDCSPASESFFGKGGGWVVAQFLVMTSWLALTPKGRKPTDSTLGRVAAAALMSAGTAAALSGSILLGKSLRPFPKPPARARLIRRGAYAVVRHPIYAGLIALSLGWACLWGSARGAALALVQAVFLDAKARREERWLREKFPDYGQYAAEVRRLIPWIY